MVAGLLKLVFILCTIAVVGLSVVDTLWFNAMPESNRYKNVQAFNVVTLWIVAIVLIIKLVTMYGANRLPFIMRRKEVRRMC